MGIRRIFDIIGNSLSVGSATVATVTHDDLRLWCVACVGMGISVVCNIPRVKQRKYEAQEARMKLCEECLKSCAFSTSCVVAKKHRPKRCPLAEQSPQNAHSGQWESGR